MDPSLTTPLVSAPGQRRLPRTLLLLPLLLLPTIFLFSSFVPRISSSLARQNVRNCFLTPDPGPCQDLQERWYYNVTLQKCLPWMWGGCETKPIFKFEKGCVDAKCHEHNNPPVAEACFQTPEYGSCSGSRSGAYYNTTTNECETFVWSGCGGARPFPNLRRCREDCVKISPTPSPSPLPDSCPDVCSTDRPETNKLCNKLAGLGCSLQLCTDEDGEWGWKCSEEATECPGVCREDKTDVRRECRELEGIGCKMNTCAIGTTIAYTCDIPTIAEECPGVCFKEKSHARQMCNEESAVKLECQVQECLSAEGAGWSCGPVSVEVDDDIIISGGEIGKEYEYALKFKNENGGVAREDLYLLCDATLSMTHALATVQRDFKEVVRSRLEASNDVNFGVGYYRDERDSNSGFNNIQPITSDVDAVYRAIDSIYLRTGHSDYEEGALVALYKMATDPGIKWRENSRKILVFFGDYPGHEPSCVEGVKVTRELVVTEMKNKEITVVAVNFGKRVTPANSDREGLNAPTINFKCGGADAGSGQANYVADNTDGAVVDTPDQTKLIEEINEILANLPLKYDANTEDCDGYLTTSYSPAFPFELFPGSEQSVIQKITLNQGVCDSPTDTFKCKYEYIASGSAYPPAVVQVTDVVGC